MIIIDTDPGIDDAMAIFYAMAAPELEVIGLTTVFGNVAVDTATTNALRLVEIAGRADVPVCRGASRSLTRPFPGAATLVHGSDGQGDAGLLSPRHAEDPRRATQFIIESVMAHPGEITLVALGPLTNLALAVLERPEFARYVRQVVCMGGNVFVPGNASPAAEANVLSDPEATRIVLSQEWPVTMCGLDVTHRITMTPADMERIFTIPTRPAEHLARILPHYRAFYEANVTGSGIFVHDSTTISYLLHPDAFETQTLALQVDTSDGISRGKLWPDRDSRERRTGGHAAGSAGERLVTICRDVDARRVVEAEIAALRERG